MKTDKENKEELKVNEIPIEEFDFDDDIDLTNELNFENEE